MKDRILRFIRRLFCRHADGWGLAYEIVTKATVDALDLTNPQWLVKLKTYSTRTHAGSVRKYSRVCHFCGAKKAATKKDYSYINRIAAPMSNYAVGTFVKPVANYHWSDTYIVFGVGCMHPSRHDYSLTANCIWVRSLYSKSEELAVNAAKWEPTGDIPDC